jgi:hypothetical protein
MKASASASSDFFCGDAGLVGGEVKLAGGDVIVDAGDVAVEVVLAEAGVKGSAEREGGAGIFDKGLVEVAAAGGGGGGGAAMFARG